MREEARYDPARAEPYTPVEVCEIARAALAQGYGASNIRELEAGEGTFGANGVARRVARDLFPGPYVMRPRVAEADGIRFRCAGAPEWSCVDGTGQWYRIEPQSYPNFTPAQLRAIALVVERPMEGVSEEVAAHA